MSVLRCLNMDNCNWYVLVNFESSLNPSLFIYLSLCPLSVFHFILLFYIYEFNQTYMYIGTQLLVTISRFKSHILLLSCLWNYQMVTLLNLFKLLYFYYYFYFTITLLLITTYQLLLRSAVWIPFMDCGFILLLLLFAQQVVIGTLDNKWCASLLSFGSV